MLLSAGGLDCAGAGGGGLALGAGFTGGLLSSGFLGELGSVAKANTSLPPFPLLLSPLLDVAAALELFFSSLLSRL